MKASFVTNYLINNKIFDIGDHLIHRDNFCYFYFKLKEEFNIKGIDLSTSDINKEDDSDIVLYAGLNQHIKNVNSYEHYYLLLLESPHVDKNLIDTSKHKFFKKIFTWNDDLIDNKKYFKVNYAFQFPKHIPKKCSKNKLCCLIVGNKSSNDTNELYSKRIEAIRWFENNHPDDFDLFGVGWDEYNFGHSIIGRILNKIKFLKKLFATRYPSYKGKIKSKNETMQNYKFAICYENIKDQNGYITEKIFDCFFAGCVPIYWGAKNITDHIPENCFIDKRKFHTYEELYRYINSMDDITYLSYLDNIEEFLKSSESDPFKAEVFAQTIVTEILKDFENLEVKGLRHV